MRNAPAPVLATCMVAALALAGCSAGAAAGPDPSTGAITGDVQVFAAASLREVFADLGELFEAQHPGTTVTFNFAASSALSTQLLAGAEADVLATADATTMEQTAEVTDEPAVFAHNVLAIATPADNPGGVDGLDDLADPDLVIALCAQEVPCGRAAVRLFEAAGITPAPDTYETDVAATLAAVVLGEVDAALVYRTDLVAAGDDVVGIDVPHADEARNDDLVTTLSEAPNPAAAQAFVDLVLSEQGQDLLVAAGFDGA